MFEIIDFADVSKTKGDDLKARMLEEIVPQLVNAERGARPILDEIGSVMKALQAGVPQDEDGVPCTPRKCDRLDESRGILLQLGSVLDQAFLVINSLWGSSFSRSDFSKIREFVGGKFGSEHIVSKLIADDYSWLIDLRELIRLAENDTGAWGVRDFQVSEDGPDGKFLVTLPTFSNGQQIANSIEVYQHNLFTFIEEITVFSLADSLDSRLMIHEMPESMRNKSAPVRFRVGVRPGIDVNTFKGHPRLSKIYRSGEHLFHLREHLREGRFGKLRPIIHSDHNGRKVVAVGNTVYFGNWVTFADFLYDFLKMKFGKDRWLTEAKKEPSSSSVIMDWAQKLYEHQKKHSVTEGNLFSVLPSGPMHAYYSLAYDLFVLEDNQALQTSLIRIRRSRPG